MELSECSVEWPTCDSFGVASNCSASGKTLLTRSPNLQFFLGKKKKVIRILEGQTLSPISKGVISFSKFNLAHYIFLDRLRKTGACSCSSPVPPSTIRLLNHPEALHGKAVRGPHAPSFSCSLVALALPSSPQLRVIGLGTEA